MSDPNQQEVRSVAIRAIDIALTHHHEMVTLEHVLLALLENIEIQKCLKSISIDIDALTLAMNEFLTGGFINVTNSKPVNSVSFEVLFQRVIAMSHFTSRKAITSVDILLYLLQFPHEDSFAITALKNVGLTSLAIKKYLSHGVAPSHRQGMHENVGPDGSPQEVEPNNREEAVNYLKKYATNLNEFAKVGKIDPVIGRANELDLTMQIIARRTKNNCVYVGPAGVGKTAIAEGIAYKIVQGEVPTLLKNGTVWALDIGALVAGTRFRGDFEERMKLVLKSLMFLSEPLPESDPKSPDLSILFIDEIHTIMEAGSGSRGALDVSNMLKPALAKGTLRCIGSTTDEEFRKYFEKDRALVRRFKKVQIDEPSPELTKAILRGLKGIYEDFHNIKYTNAALDAAVDLTHRYVHTAFLPDKAIDIIDQAGARQRITAEDERVNVIDAIQIETEVSKVVKIPTKDISEGDSEKLARLEADLESAVYGQPQALKALTNAVMISRAGLRELNLPAGAYLFSGPTGVGKCLGYNQKINVKISKELLDIVLSLENLPTKTGNILQQ